MPRGRPKGTPKTGGRIKSTDTQLPPVRVTKTQAQIAQAAGSGITSPGNKAEELAQLFRVKGFSNEIQEGKMARKVITDSPEKTGYLDGYQQTGRREPSDQKQSNSYEKGYKRGCRDRAADS